MSSRLFSRNWRNYSVLVVGLLLMYTHLPGKAVEFEVDGIVVFSHRMPNGLYLFYQEDSFEMTVADDGRWSLKQTPLKHLKRKEDHTHFRVNSFASSDLTNLYQLVTFPTNGVDPAMRRNLAPKGTQARTNMPVNNQSGMIARGVVPYGFGDTKVYVYCSSERTVQTS